MKTRLLIAVVGMVVVGATVGAWAVAATVPNKTTGSISACYANSTGTLRVATTACDPSTETKLSWQAGPVALRADIASGDPDATLMSNKDGLTLSMSCYVNLGGVWIADLHLASKVTAHVNGAFVPDTDSGPNAAEDFGQTINAGSDAVIVEQGRGGGGFARAEGEFTVDTPAHIVTVVFHMVSNSVTQRCQFAGTATLA